MNSQAFTSIASNPPSSLELNLGHLGLRLIGREIELQLGRSSFDVVSICERLLQIGERQELTNGSVARTTKRVLILGERSLSSNHGILHLLAFPKKQELPIISKAQTSLIQAGTHQRPEGLLGSLRAKIETRDSITIDYIQTHLHQDSKTPRSVITRHIGWQVDALQHLAQYCQDHSRTIRIPLAGKLGRKFGDLEEPTDLCRRLTRICQSLGMSVVQEGLMITVKPQMPIQFEFSDFSGEQQLDRKDLRPLNLVT